MIIRSRGVLAAFLLSGPLLAAPAYAAMAGPQPLAPGEIVLPSGITTEVRHATASGAVALEVWIRCPSNGWDGTRPGIARLTALAVVSAKSGGASLRDIVRARGGELNLSVFQTATEIAVIAPASKAAELQDALVRAVFKSSLDAPAFGEAQARLAAEQAAAAQSTVEVLRDRVFAELFSSGPMRDSTFGDARLLKSATLTDLRDFAARSYVPANAIAVSVGNADAKELAAHLGAATSFMAASSPQTVPASPLAPVPAQPIAVSSSDVDLPGVALAWAGPPISDQRAATAMDFLSDYLADQRAGVFARAATAANAGASIAGQFVTLENPGVFFVSATGENVDPAAMEKALRDGLTPVLSRPLSQNDFARALDAYETRLLRQMNSAQGLADNYGWYFAQNAPAYAPSATDASLGGAYFANAASLTPDYVRDVARRYLGVRPIVITLVPVRAPVKVSPGGT